MKTTARYELIDRLEKNQTLHREEFITLIEHHTPALSEYLFAKARSIRDFHYGKQLYLRGLIEFTSYCKNDCLYCGIRNGNHHASRYRLTREEILQCCEQGYRLGFRTFVLQGGEDPFYTDDRLVELLHSIKHTYPDCAITLSIGERTRERYQAYREAGADRYLLRHETANAVHYAKLHPHSSMTDLVNRIRCLYDLKDLGYQVGTGFMVGSPFQTSAHLAEDLAFIQELQPHMVGIGPFIPHKDTPFRNAPPGSVELTLFMLGLLRLMLPKVLLPATTALGTISENGRQLGILAGANVIMPNLSPIDVRKKYLLYDNKICTGEEGAESIAQLERHINEIGYCISQSRGDAKR